MKRVISFKKKVNEKSYSPFIRQVNNVVHLQKKKKYKKTYVENPLGFMPIYQLPSGVSKTWLQKSPMIYLPSFGVSASCQRIVQD